MSGSPKAEAEHPRGRGRRPGLSDSRRAILDVALTQFSEHGYAGTSLRSVARAAGVDPSLVTHYFGTKEGLFVSALDNIGPVQARLAQVMKEGGDDRPRRLAQAYLSAWEDPTSGPRLRAVFRAASESPVAAGIVRRALESKAMAEPVAASPGLGLATVEAFMSQLAGVAFARYILEVHPLADLPLTEVVELVLVEPPLSQP
jgi:AcrR family transcriptional regulator